MAEEETVAASAVSSDNKRKLVDLEPETKKNEVSSPRPDIKTEISSSPPSQSQENSAHNHENSNSSSLEVQNDIQKVQEIAAHLANTAEVKRPRLEEQTDIHDLDHPVQTTDEPPKGNSQPLSTGDLQQPIPPAPQRGDLFSGDQQPNIEPENISRRIEVPNGKVGVLIGKAGETIRNLQFNSGAKIQITRDCDANPYSTTRAVELIGTSDNVNKAEQLIKDVIAEAEAGGSPALVAKGFGTSPTGGEQIQIQVPNEKVGFIIGKGGETIKSLQTRSGARIQLIPQHLPEGDISRERTVRVTGNIQQIEAAREMIKDVLNQPLRSSSISGGYNQQGYRPRGPAGPPQWGARAPPPMQQAAGYDYQQRGPFPSQAPQFPPQTYPSYPQQAAPRSTFNSGWDQRPQAPMQTQPPQSGGYDYYGQANHIADASGSAPAPVTAPTLGPTQVNYNYGQLQGTPDYAQPTSYSQSLAPQQSYAHDPNYEKQASAQHVYAGGPNLSSQQTSYPQPVSSQPGYMQPVTSQPAGYTQQGSGSVSGYPQASASSGYTQQGYPQASAPSGYTQPGYGNPTYGTSSPGPAPQPYAPPRTASQPGDAPYQGSTAPVSAQSYGSGMPSQQSYPYGSSGASQQSYPYGPTSGTSDVYTQSQQPVSGGGGGGYGQYPSAQPGYGDQQQTQNNVNYGYQGPADTGYNNSQQASAYGGPTGSYGGAYGAPTSVQGGYGQPASNLSSNEQAAPQSGYANVSAPPAGYTKSLSPQPGYSQYESGQIYGRY